MVARAVSALATVVRDDGLILAADRGPGRDGERKLFVLENGLAVGVLGQAVVELGHEPPLDLLSLTAARASSCVGSAAAAAAVLTEFHQVAPSVRAVVGGCGVVVPPFSVEVLMAVLVAQFTGSDPDVFAIGLTIAGPCALEQVGPPGIAWGPEACVPDLGLVVMNASRAANTHVARDVLVEGIRSSSVREGRPGPADVDLVVLEPGRLPVASTDRLQGQTPHH